MAKKININFDYYKPINKQQIEFHASKSKHKLLIGGYGSGKTYPAIHEAFFICLDNPGCQFAVFRNTWESLTEHVEREMIEVGENAGIISQWDKTRHDLYLVNGTVIRFRPLSLKRAQFKGLNICGFFIDDPDINKTKETIAFLYSRLRNTPIAKANYFQTIITANYEGHNWLWQMYMRGRDQGGDGKFAYWICPTDANPTLPEDFIEDLNAVHSDRWMDRFVYCKMDSYAGLVYDEYNFKIHDKDLRWCHKDKDIIKILAIDVGITDPTVILSMATDFKCVYVYDEWYHPNVRSNVVGEYLSREKQKENFRALVIDPSSARKEQTSGSSVRDDLRREYGVGTVPGNNAKEYGIELIKTLLTVRENDETHFYVDTNACPHFVREMEVYSWKEPEMSEFDELAHKEKTVDRDDHCMDAARYGVCYLKKFIRGIFNKERIIENRNLEHRNEKYSKLKMYRENPSLRQDHRTKRFISIHNTARRSINPFQ